MRNALPEPPEGRGLDVDSVLFRLQTGDVGCGSPTMTSPHCRMMVSLKSGRIIRTQIADFDVGMGSIVPSFPCTAPRDGEPDGSICRLSNGQIRFGVLGV